MIILALALTGCTTAKPTDTQIVYVPVQTKCKPLTNITQIDEHPKDKMLKESSLFEKLQLILAELKLVEGQNTELSVALSECTK